MLRRIIIILLFLTESFIQAETILVIDSYDESHPWVMSYRQGLDDTIGKHYSLRYFPMNTKQLPKEHHQSKAEEAWAIYKETSPSLVILADDNALTLLADRFIYTPTAVVYLGINGNPRNYNLIGASNFSGVVERPLIKRSVGMLKQYMTVTKVLLLFDDSETSQVILGEEFAGKYNRTISGIETDIALIGNYSDWQDAVLKSKSNGYDAIFVGLYHTVIDNNQDHVDSDKVIRWTSDNTPVPTFGFWDFSIGADKNIGGYVLSGYNQGKVAGDIALKQLSKPSQQIIRRYNGDGQYMFSYHQLEKWDISLPGQIREKAILIE